MQDYNCSVEFVRSTFLVQEWEIPDGNGSTKETLRLDLVERSCDKYKGADVLVFNTGHWWTHEKTSEGYHPLFSTFRRVFICYIRFCRKDVYFDVHCTKLIYYCINKLLGRATIKKVAMFMVN